MSQLVKLREMPDGGKRARDRARLDPTFVMYVDPKHVGVVAPRTGYTSILVDGAWLHVDHTFDEVMRALGKIDV